MIHSLQKFVVRLAVDPFTLDWSQRIWRTVVAACDTIRVHSVRRGIISIFLTEFARVPSLSPN